MKVNLIVLAAVVGMSSIALAGPTSGGGVSGVQFLVICQKEQSNSRFNYFSVSETADPTVQKGILVDSQVNNKETDFTCIRSKNQKNTGKKMIYECKQQNSTEGLLAEVAYGYSGAVQVQIFKSDFAGQKINVPRFNMGCDLTQGFKK